MTVRLPAKVIRCRCCGARFIAVEFVALHLATDPYCLRAYRLVRPGGYYHGTAYAQRSVGHTDPWLAWAVGPGGELVELGRFTRRRDAEAFAGKVNG
jgi:hypothetical protein